MNAKPATLQKLRSLILESEGGKLEDHECSCRCGGCDKCFEWEISEKITLPRVLMALENKLCWKVSTGDFEGHEENPIAIKEDYHVRKEFRKVLYLWNLHHTAENQTEETLLSIINILEV